MGVIYKILKQQRQQQQQQQQQLQQQQQHMELSTATKCKVQAAIKQRQQMQQVQLEQRVQKEQQATHEETLAEQQLQQLCRFLAENAARKKRQRLKLKLQCQYNHMKEKEQAEHPLCELPQLPQVAPHGSTHDMDMLMEQLGSTCSDVSPTKTTMTTTTGSVAPRDSILLKIRHQIFERKRQRQRQLGELVKQRMVVWRPW